MMTPEQAIALAETGWWKDRTPEDIVSFQLFIPDGLLCMDFGDFQRAVEKCLGRPVYSHEFGTVGWKRLQAEFLKEKQAPTFQEILDLIPPEKRIVIL